LTLDRHLRNLIAGLRVDLIVDVGAHHGEFARRLRHPIGYEKLILSFEPDPDSFSTLCERMDGDSQWHGINVALSYSVGEAVLHEFKSTEFNSLHVPNQLAETRFGVRATGQRTVSTNRLDGLVDESAGVMSRAASIMLKMDTQGHELRVIRGAGTLLDNTSVILAEAAALPIYTDVPTIDVVIAELRDRGFDPSAFFPISVSSDRMRAIEFDGIFINRRFL